MSKFVDFYLIGELVDSHGNVHYKDLKNLPTADLAEVVRCKDCKHFHDGIYSGEYWMKCDEYRIALSSDEWFCADGERKEDDER